jgi:hypothetical protein
MSHDLEAAIAHVVGQGVVALAAGCEIHLSVDPHPSGKSFDGNCWVRNPHGEISAQLKRVIGVAGRIAELALERGSPDDLESAEVFYTLQSAVTAEAFTLADVALALDALRSRWALVTGEVARMSPQIMSNIPRIH